MPPRVEKHEDGPRDQSDSPEGSKTNANTSPQNTPADSTINEPQSSSSKPATVHIPFLDRLRALPELRSIPWRPGQELPPERSVDSPRVQQRGAILLSTRGQVAATPCEHCAAGYGRFSVCITLNNWFQGACSSCIYTSKGNKCSLRAQTSGNADGRALRYHTDNPEVLQTYIRNAAENPKPQKKRKRRSEMQPASSADASYTSPYPQQDSPLPVSPDEDTLLQTQIAREQAAGPLGDAGYTGKRQNWQHDPSQPNIARIRGPVLPYTTPYPAPSPNTGDGQKEVLVPTPAYQPPWPSYRAPRPDSPPINTIIRRAPVPEEKPVSAIIDSVPKAKQRELYAVVSGLQGGIDNLQKRLDSFKSLLGISEEEYLDPR